MSKIVADKIEAGQESQIDLEDLPVDETERDKVKGSSGVPQTHAYSVVIDRRPAL